MVHLNQGVRHSIQVCGAPGWKLASVINDPLGALVFMSSTHCFQLFHPRQNTFIGGWVLNLSEELTLFLPLTPHPQPSVGQMPFSEQLLTGLHNLTCVTPCVAHAFQTTYSTNNIQSFSFIWWELQSCNFTDFQNENSWIVVIPTQISHTLYRLDNETHHNKLTQLKNLWKFWTHGILQMFGFSLRHLTTGEVKNLFTKKLEDSHIILTEAFIGLACTHNVRNKGFPVLRPLALQYLMTENRNTHLLWKYKDNNPSIC